MQLFHIAFNVHFKSMFHGHCFNLHTILLKIEVGKQFIRKTIYQLYFLTLPEGIPMFIFPILILSFFWRDLLIIVRHVSAHTGGQNQ